MNKSTANVFNLISNKIRNLPFVTINQKKKKFIRIISVNTKL